MTYLLQTRKKKNIFSFLFKSIFFLLLVVFLFSFFSTPFKNLSNYLSRVFLPDAFLSFLSSKQDLYKENESLKQENATLKADLEANSLLVEENQRLRESLSLVDSGEFTIGEVILRGGKNNAQNKIVARVGKEVFVGDLVFFRKIPVGRVVEFKNSLATILLLSAPENTFSALIGDPSFESEAHGLGNGSFEIFVPKGVVVSVGDDISIPSFGSGAFSKISDISSDSADAFQRILFSFPFNLNYVDFVSIKKASE